MTPAQVPLLGRGEPRFDPGFCRARRLPLSAGAWIEHVPGWLDGHQVLFDALVAGTRWRAERRMMYERMVAVPRLCATIPNDGPGHPILGAIVAALAARYRWRLDQIGLAHYRDGRDSVAMHGDKLGPLRNNAVIAILSVGEPRRFLLRPVVGGGRMGLSLGWGDLLVMGGSCQQTWLHGVPKVARAGPRISIQFRPSQAPEPDRLPMARQPDRP